MGKVERAAIHTVCVHSGVVYVEMDKDLEKRFRIKVAEKFGGQKGATKKAIEEAVKLWLKG